MRYICACGRIHSLKQGRSAASDWEFPTTDWRIYMAAKKPAAKKPAAKKPAAKKPAAKKPAAKKPAAKKPAA